MPVPFSRPGTYPNPGSPKKQKTAFSRGTLYIRHGAKSEPATRADIAAIIERRLASERQTLLQNVRRVVEAPTGTEIIPIRRGVTDEQGNPTAIRLTTDPGSPVYGKLNPDLTHPYRQRELIAEVNRRLPRGKAVNTHDLLSVRRPTVSMLLENQSSPISRCMAHSNTATPSLTGWSSKSRPAPASSTLPGGATTRRHTVLRRDSRLRAAKRRPGELGVPF